jgi:hypothetical protein
MSSTEARRFGLQAMALLALVALWLWLRKHHPAAALATAGAGALLGLSGFVTPAALLLVKSAWMGLGRVIGRVNGTIVLVVIFFLVLTPVALVRRLFRRSDGKWEPHEKRARDHFENPY